MTDAGSSEKQGRLVKRPDTEYSSYILFLDPVHSFPTKRNVNEELSKNPVINIFQAGIRVRIGKLTMMIIAEP